MTPLRGQGPDQHARPSSSPRSWVAALRLAVLVKARRDRREPAWSAWSCREERLSDSQWPELQPSPQPIHSSLRLCLAAWSRLARIETSLGSGRRKSKSAFRRVRREERFWGPRSFRKSGPWSRMSLRSWSVSFLGLLGRRASAGRLIEVLCIPRTQLTPARFSACGGRVRAWPASSCVTYRCLQAVRATTTVPCFSNFAEALAMPSCVWRGISRGAVELELGRPNVISRGAAPARLRNRCARV
jgi:hypothetical protein